MCYLFLNSLGFQLYFFFWGGFCLFINCIIFFNCIYVCVLNVFFWWELDGGRVWRGDI